MIRRLGSFESAFLSSLYMLLLHKPGELVDSYFWILQELVFASKSGCLITLNSANSI